MNTRTQTHITHLIEKNKCGKHYLMQTGPIDRIMRITPNFIGTTTTMSMFTFLCVILSNKEMNELNARTLKMLADRSRNRMPFFLWFCLRKLHYVSLATDKQTTWLNIF